MAGAFSQYLQAKVLDHIFKVATFAEPTNIYIGLCTSAPSDISIGTEVSGSNYSRVNVNTAFAAATSASPSVITNSSQINFPTPGTGGWGIVTHFIIMDSQSTSTNILAWGQLTVSKTINQNDVVSLSVGQVSISLD